MPQTFSNRNLYDVYKIAGNTAITPSEELTDPVGKLRVSTPQALIDTDFEYSTQSTKWETLNLLNNRPSAFYDVTAPLTITAVSASTTTITVSTTAPPAVGTPIYVQNTTNPAANGWFIVESVSAGVSFNYSTNTSAGSGSIYDTTKTYIFAGSFYTNSAIPVSASAGAAFTNATTTVTCTTTNAHGLTPGDAIYVIGTTATTNPPNGAWIVRTTPTVNTFTFVVLNAPTGTITATAGASATLYPRPYGSVIHRPFDGGVAFSAGYPYSGNQLIRQTRRYFRYQSGKGIQFSTGTSLKPAFFLDTISATGTTVTVTTKAPHNIGVGAFVQVTGSTDPAINGIYPVLTVPSDLTFTYTANATPIANGNAAGFPITVNPYSWYGSKTRIGLFDDQNGFFFEYDGQTLYAVKRSSTTQIAGNVSVTNNSTSVTGTGTLFSSQLAPGNYIVIRGMTYLVHSILSNTSLVIYPEYRGTTASNCITSKTVDEKYPQTQWNIDRCDGKGQTKFNLDLTKMQMLYIDYAWYGAGAIRFGFKDQNGNIIYCHRIPNSNRNTEAYMRSGNMCARYETNVLTAYTSLGATLSNIEVNTLTVSSTADFPTSGILCLTAPGNTTAAIEYVRYTGKTATTFTGLTRAVTNLTGPGGLTGGGGASSAQTFTYSATAPVLVSFFPAQFSSTLSHWGSAVVMDGRYDDDKSYIFQAGMNTAITNIAASGTSALLSIRLAPSVDSGLTGSIGARELINRMQLTLRQMDVVATGAAVIFRVELILNGRVSGGTYTPAGGSSLAQVCIHSAGTTVTGGETIFSFFVYTPSVVQQELGLVRDLGNSILGGGTSLTAPTTTANLYPDGPDVVTVRVTNVSVVATNSIQARLSWTEAQA